MYRERVFTNDVNARIAQHGYELVKANGYYYFAPLSGNSDLNLRDSSVQVSTLNQLNVDEWEQELLEKIRKTEDSRKSVDDPRIRLI
jgi:hypothetical protein